MNIREEAAKYYDLQDNSVDDVPFYLVQVCSPSARILELGCGTGRVLAPLAHASGHIHGVDSSEAMLAICASKIAQEGLPDGRTALTCGNITDLDLNEQFDLIVAPFRVMQNLETDAEVDGLMGTIRRHLAAGGTAILNTFKLNLGVEELRKRWSVPDEEPDGEAALPGGGRLVRTTRRARLQAEPLVLYPELIYRRYSAAGELEDEAVLKIAMRCWHPHELEQLITGHGFRITGRWGGYAGEAWNEGSELVIGFQP